MSLTKRSENCDHFVLTVKVELAETVIGGLNGGITSCKVKRFSF